MGFTKSNKKIRSKKYILSSNNKTSKKGMIVGQIFIYSLSLFIVSLILIYGYMVISDFIGSSSNVELLQFQKNIENYVKSYSTEYGSEGYKEISTPGNIITICFTDYYSMSSSLNSCSGLTTTYEVIEDSYLTDGLSMGARERKNIFLVDAKGEVTNSYYLGNVSVVPQLGGPLSCNYLCIDSLQGKFHIRIKGKGVGVEIADATP